MVKWKDSGSFRLTKMQWVLMEKQSNSSGKFHKIFIVVYSSRNPTRLERRNSQSEEFKDQIIFMSMFNDIEWKTNDENCISNAGNVKNHAMRFSQGHSWVQGRMRSGMEILLTVRKETGILQPTNWCNDSNKLVILCTKVSVP